MADNIFDIEIITPDRVFYKGETDFFEFNTQNGEIGVYKNHIPLTTELAEWPDEIDVDRAQAAKERAEQRLSNHTAEIDVKRAEFALRKALIRIDVAHHM